MAEIRALWSRPLRQHPGTAMHHGHGQANTSTQQHKAGDAKCGQQGSAPSPRGRARRLMALQSQQQYCCETSARNQKPLLPHSEYILWGWLPLAVKLARHNSKPNRTQISNKHAPTFLSKLLCNKCKHFFPPSFLSSPSRQAELLRKVPGYPRVRCAAPLHNFLLPEPQLDLALCRLRPVGGVD